MEFVSESALNILDSKRIEYSANGPFPYIVIDNFLNIDKANSLHHIINELDKRDADRSFLNKNSKNEYNKYSYSTDAIVSLTNRNKIFSIMLNLFDELNSPLFLKKLEHITSINDLIADRKLVGAGIHKTYTDGYLGIHTDFNTYYTDKFGRLDRRINLLIYMNKEYNDEFNGHLQLYEKQIGSQKMKMAECISPIFNRCVIFNTSSKSLHGHPLPLCKMLSRNSIANYYYTKNVRTDGKDFEGDAVHDTIFY